VGPQLRARNRIETDSQTLLSLCVGVLLPVSSLLLLCPALVLVFSRF